MTNAPEKLYLNKNSPGVLCIELSLENDGKSIHYLRADIAERMISEARDKALEEAANICDHDEQIGRGLLRSQLAHDAEVAMTVAGGLAATKEKL